MSITPVSSTTTAGKTPSATSGLAATSDTFLKLLVTNMQHQDPTKPQDTDQYVNQISQMTMVEQMTKLSSASQTTVDQQRIAAVVALLGHTVSYVGADGAPASGVVSKIDVTAAKPTITVGSVTGLDPSSISTVS
jgi:flagellar basal-body rod modification protein FlgD